MKKLSKKEIYERTKQWHNMKKMYAAAIESNKTLKEMLKLLKESLEKERLINKEQSEQIQDLKLLVEELQEMVFGKKKKNDDDDSNFFTKKKDKKKSKKRSKDSYLRKIPDKKDITDTKTHNIDKCSDCNTKLSRKKIAVYYEEDIPLPEKDKKLKKVIEYHVEKGYCNKCKKWHTAIAIPSKKVIIGKNVKLYICYLSILLRLSFEQIQNILRDTYGFEISDGEIANILHKTGEKLRPIFERIKIKLQTEGNGVHMDETSWGKMYMWVMAAIEGDDVIYLAGRNRGNGHIDELLGDSFNGVRVNDAYAAYKNKDGVCQQCWAHPHRKLRDLASSKSLSKKIRKHCIGSYEEFSEMYSKIRECIKEPFDKERRRKQKEELLEDIKRFRIFDKKDPKKLHNIKKQFINCEQEFLTCMDYDGVPCDNNKAERMLRHFVIKRKISYGNKTEKGARALETLASVFMTYWKKFERNFFSEMLSLCEKLE